MMFSLNEDNKSIEELINYINSKMVELRKNKKLNPKILTDFQMLYMEIVDPWMTEYNLTRQEPKLKIEQQINDDLLELISYLNKL
jgi:hypothetical protein